MKHTQGDNPMIELRAISEDNFRECLLLRASVENEDFVDPVTYSSMGLLSRHKAVCYIQR